MVNLNRGERFKDARLVHNKIGSETMAEVAKATGVSASLIKELEDDSSTRDFGYKKIAELAKHYGVSANWLLELTDDHRVLPCATDELLLSESAVEAIRYYSQDSGDALRGLDRLLNSPDFWGVCLTVERLKKSIDALSLDAYPIADITTQRNLEDEIIAAHPDLRGKIQVLYGDMLTSALAKQASDFFGMAMNQVTGLDNRRCPITKESFTSDLNK